MGSFAQDIKEYYKFTQDEIRSYVLATVVLAFILSFNEWGTDRFELATGIVNYIKAVIIVLIGLLVHDAGHRLVALKTGHRIEFRLWAWGLLGVLGVVLFTNGDLRLFLAGGVLISEVERLRHGKVPVQFRNRMLIGAAGPLTSLAFAAFMIGLSNYLPINEDLLFNLIYFNLVYGFMNMLPMPALDGFKVLYHSRIIFFVIIGTILGYFFLALIGIFSLFLAFILGIGAWLLFYYWYESK